MFNRLVKSRTTIYIGFFPGGFMRSRIAVFVAFAFAALFLAFGLLDSEDKRPKQQAKAPSAREMGALPVSNEASGKSPIAKDEIQDSRYFADQIVVRFKDDATAGQRRRAVSAVDGEIVDTIRTIGTELVRLPDGANVNQARKTLGDTAGVAFAEPNFVTRTTAAPNDPLFQHQWSLNNNGQEILASLTGQGPQNYRLRDGATGQTISSFIGNADADIDAPEAWETETGSPDVTVAVVDTGIDYNHPDLANRIWTNDGESGEGRESNGVDDDLNGLVDDWRGWDFYVPGGGIGDNDPFDDNLHGTHVAGTIAAAGNDGVGVTGVSQNSKIMPLKILNEAGFGSSFDSAKALAYAANNGADVVNGSYGSYAPNNVEREAIEQSPDTLFVFAAGNDSNDLGASAAYPCEYPQENVVCVAATDDKDRLASFSNYGSVGVDLGAPGVNILSDKSSVVEIVTGNYLFLSGTSMASPHVAGAAALVKSHRPDASALAIKQALLESVDPLEVLDGKTSTGGRLNVANALDAISGETQTDSTVSAPSWSKSMTYRAGAGSTENLVVSEASGAIIFNSGGPAIDAGAGCSNTNPSVVSCAKAGFTGVTIQTFDLADQVTIDVDLDAYVDTGDGNDSVLGGDGDDTVLASEGDDVISGRGGDDAVSYGMRAAAVSVSADGQPGDGQAGESDNINTDVEIIRGGKGNDVLTSSSQGKELTGNAGDDSLLGGPGSEVISGRSGIDTITGGEGDDRLLGGEDSDTINGNGGTDTADYSESYDGVNLSLDNQRNDGLQGEEDFLANDIENLVGSYANDIMSGNSLDNRFEGGRADDFFAGGGGKDTFIGGETWPSHEWDIDTVSYELNTTAVSVTQDGIANDGSISANEQDNVYSDVEEIIGGRGNDIFSGGDDQNQFIGGLGNDVFGGGGGGDAVSYRDTSQPVVASRDGQANDGPSGQTDSIGDDIEGIVGGGGDDQLSVTGSTDSILMGHEGNDQLFGGSGEDLFAVEDGNDSVHGGNGDDLFISDCWDLELWCTPAPTYPGWSMRVSLDNQAGDGRPSESDNIHDDVEGLFGSAGDDVLTGSENADFIAGSGGRDRIIGKGGNDRLCGDDSCDDRFPIAGAGWFDQWDDTIDAGSGNDFVYSDIGDDQVLAGAGDDVVEASPEASIYPGPDNDTVFGQDGNDSIQGRNGDDRLTGGSGQDNLSGGAGADTLSSNDFDADVTDCGGEIDSATVDSADDPIDCETATVTSPVQTPSPQIISPVAGSWTSISSVPVMWASSGDVASFTCSIDGGQTIPCSSGIEVSGNGWHTIVVTAIDSQGNSGSDSRSFGIDAGPIQYAWIMPGNTAKRQPAIGATASSPSGIASIRCSIDDNGMNEAIPCSGGVAWPIELSIGTHQYKIQITNNVGATVTTSNYFEVAASPPSFQITSPSPGQIAPTSMTVRWTKAPATKTTTCSVDGAAFVSCGTSITVTGVGMHTVDVRQVDDIGGVGTASVSFGIGVPPTVSITSPTGTIADNTPTLEFTATATSGIQRTECHIPGSSPDYIPCTSGMEWPYELSNGVYTLNVRAYSNTGLPKNQTKQFTVLAPPEVTILSPSTGERIASSTVEVSFSSTNSPTGITCALDSAVAAPCSSPVSYSGLSDGDHTVQISATNGGGSGTRAVTFTVDTIAPDTVIDTGPSASSTIDDTTPSFNFHGTPISDTFGFDCRVDTEAWTPCGEGLSGSRELAPLTAGQHTFAVRARDEIGNRDGSPASRTFTVSTPGLLTVGTKTTLPTATPISLTTAGPAGWAHWGTSNTSTEAAMLTPVRKSGTTSAEIGNATRHGVQSATRVTSGVPQSTWNGVGDPAGSPTTTAISAGGSLDGGFSFTLAAPVGIARTANLYLGARSTTGKLIVSISDGSSATVTDTNVVTAGTTAASVRVPITYRATSPGAVVTVRFLQATSTSLGRVYLESVALTNSSDTTPPETTISGGPVPGSVISTATPSFSFVSSEPQSTFQCKVDSGAYSNCTSAFTTPTLAVGPHTFKVRAIDPSGNVDPSAATAVDFWVSLPVGMIRQGSKSSLAVGTPVNLTTAGTSGWAHWGTGTSTTESVLLAPTRKNGTTISTISNATRTGTTTASRVGVGIPQTLWSGAGDSTGSPTTTAIQAGGGTAAGGGFSFTVAVPTTNSRTINLYLGAINTTGKLVATLSDGSAPAVTDTSVVTGTTTAANVLVPITVRAANAGATLSIQYTQNTVASTGRVYLESVALVDGTDTIAPVTTFRSGPLEGAVVSSPNVSFAYTSSESGGTYQCRLDGGSFGTCGPSVAYFGLSSGLHTFYVRSIDSQGNVEGKPARRSFTIL